MLAAISGDRTAESGTEAVQFSFKHLLSKITIRLTNASDNAELIFNNVHIANMIKTGKCVCKYDPVNSPYPQNVVWTQVENANLEEFCFGSGTVAVKSNVATHIDLEFYVIPQSNDKILTMELIQKVDNKVLESEDLAFNLNTTTTLQNGTIIANSWVPGYHYRYVITKGKTYGQIEFEVNVNQWNQDRNNDNEITNEGDVIIPNPITSGGSSGSGDA